MTARMTTLPPSGKPIAVKPRAIAERVELDYLTGEPFQWLIELARNSMQVKARNIKFGIDRTAATRGILRRYIVDDGPSMSPDDLEAYFSYLGEGAGAHGVGAKHGLGSRVSIMPWNHNGLVVVCKDDPDEPAYLIRIYYDEANEDFRMQSFWDEDDKEWFFVMDAADYRDIEDDSTDWPALIETPTGTAFVLLGSDESPHTVNGDPRRSITEGNVRNGWRYLNTRLVDYDPDITIRFEEPNRKSKDGSTKRIQLGLIDIDGDGTLYEYEKHDRKIEGMRAVLTERAEAHDRVRVDDLGTYVEWFLVKPTDTKEKGIDKLYGRGGRHIHVVAALTQDGITESYNQFDRSKLRDFGIHGDTATRTYLIVVPPAYKPGMSGGAAPAVPETDGAIPDGARSDLIWGYAGKELPWQAWGDEFFRQMPPEIDAAMKAHTVVTDTDALRKMLEPFMGEFARKLTQMVGVPTKDSSKADTTTEPGTAPGRPKPEGPPRKRKRPRRPRKPTTRHGKDLPAGKTGTGTVDAAGKERASDFPTPVWEKTSNPKMFAEWIPTANQVTLNPEHPVYTNMLHRYLGMYGGLTGADKEVEATVRLFLEAEVCSSIAHVKAQTDNVGWDATEQKEILSDGALTAKVYGLVNLDRLIRERLSFKLRKPKAKKPAA